jgi:hypothetical protein
MCMCVERTRCFCKPGPKRLASSRSPSSTMLRGIVDASPPVMHPEASPPKDPARRALQRTALPRLRSFSLSTIQTAQGASTYAHAAEKKVTPGCVEKSPPHAHGRFSRTRPAPTRQRPSDRWWRQCDAQDQSCRCVRDLSSETRQGSCSVHFASR